jgi:LytS/YehU family sensor histidine kinase
VINTLVENAINYGMKNSQNGITMTINARIIEQELKLEIIDTVKTILRKTGWNKT